VVRALLEAGANANIQTVSSAVGIDGVTKQTPLHVAVEAGHKDIVRTFLDFKGTCVFYVSFLTTREVVWYIISVVSVCLSVCVYVYQTTFESLDVGSSYLHIRWISSLHVKVIGSMSRLQKQKVENPYSRNVKL